MRISLHNFIVVILVLSLLLGIFPYNVYAGTSTSQWAFNVNEDGWTLSSPPGNWSTNQLITNDNSGGTGNSANALEASVSGKNRNATMTSEISFTPSSLFSGITTTSLTAQQTSARSTSTWTGAGATNTIKWELIAVHTDTSTKTITLLSDTALSSGTAWSDNTFPASPASIAADSGKTLDLNASWTLRATYTLSTNNASNSNFTNVRNDNIRLTMAWTDAPTSTPSPTPTITLTPTVTPTPTSSQGLPSSSNYKFKALEFGSGGGVNVDSSSYSMEGILGQVAGSSTSNSYGLDSGLIYAQQANVPPAPSLENNGSWYNKLLIKIDNGNNPTDATFAIAISPDNFATTYYVQSDNTISTILGPEDYQTYANWGGVSGEYIIGLNANTTYKSKVKASQGKFTESGWGPTSTGVATSNVSISFDIDIGTSSTADTNAPYSVDVGQLTPGSVTTAGNQVWIDLDTNADYGGYVYIYDQYAGLKSLVSNHTISSSSTDLSAATEGYGIQAGTTSQTSGGPLTAIAPFNGSTENVGAINSTVRELFHTTTSSIVGGRGSFYVKAKSSSVTPASNDYTDILTLIAAATF